MESADWVTGVLALAALGLGVLNSAIASRRHKASVKREKDRDAPNDHLLVVIGSA